MSNPTTSTTREAAEAFSASYAAAVAMTVSPTTSIEDIAAALASHWNPGAVVFMFGRITTFPIKDPKEHPWYNTNLRLLKRFEESELGYRVELVRQRVEVYSEGAAQCWLTWKCVPREGAKFEGKGWEWENLYGWRRPMGDQGKGFWEYVISDHEVGEMMKRIPGFYEFDD
ncbi:hypothetical protein BDZ85DRAFT_279898 [Elsinoe ampelina]|uniref:SnoaL-like domain-containing protein n=1 Tax=Elsinoe ampelina TaxID=302913 RepID=A0A6A6GGD2_9PEZI|nr:hypothetical protein BDZ85DRAFT_279898 [Elsinoe ampelina]